MQELEEHQKWLASGFSNEVEGSISSEDEEPLEKMMRTEVRLQVEKLDVILNKQDLSIIFGQQVILIISLISHIFGFLFNKKIYQSRKNLNLTDSLQY